MIGDTRLEGSQHAFLHDSYTSSFGTFWKSASQWCNSRGQGGKADATQWENRPYQLRKTRRGEKRKRRGRKERKEEKEGQKKEEGKKRRKEGRKRRKKRKREPKKRKGKKIYRKNSKSIQLTKITTIQFTNGSNLNRVFERVTPSPHFFALPHPHSPGKNCPPLATNFCYTPIWAILLNLYCHLFIFASYLLCNHWFIEWYIHSKMNRIIYLICTRTAWCEITVELKFRRTTKVVIMYQGGISTSMRRRFDVDI